MSQTESHTNWKSLYRVGGAAALIAGGLILTQGGSKEEAKQPALL